MSRRSPGELAAAVRGLVLAGWRDANAAERLGVTRGTFIATRVRLGLAAAVVRGRTPRQKTECVACGRVARIAARGRCRGCYAADLRERSGADAEIPPLSPSLRGEGGDVPPPQAAPARDWDRWPGLGRADDGLDLHASTLPDAIARGQRAAVREVLADLGPGATAEDVSAAVVLPVDVVRRRLEELTPAEG